MNENHKITIPPLGKLHHVRANTIYQAIESKAELAATVKKLLTDCGAVPRKLGRPKSIFGTVTSNKRKINISTSNKKVAYNKEIKNADKIVSRNLCKRCKKLELTIETESINRVLYNLPYHIVALFKDYLIQDDLNEFLHRFYRDYESAPRLNKIAEYYEQEGKVAPSYVLFDAGNLFAKRKKRQAKILLMKYYEKLESVQDQTTLFNTKFMESMYKERLDNSRTCVLSDKSYSALENEKLEDLLVKLNQTTSTKSIQHNNLHIYQSCPRNENKCSDYLGTESMRKAKKVVFKDMKRAKSLGSKKKQYTSNSSTSKTSTYALRSCKAVVNSYTAKEGDTMCQTQKGSGIRKLLKHKLGTKTKPNVL